MSRYLLTSSPIHTQCITTTHIHTHVQQTNERTRPQIIQLRFWFVRDHQLDLWVRVCAAFLDMKPSYHSKESFTSETPFLYLSHRIIVFIRNKLIKHQSCVCVCVQKDILCSTTTNTTKTDVWIISCHRVIQSRLAVFNKVSNHWNVSPNFIFDTEINSIKLISFYESERD